jgi:ferritin-like metal-binding protein YciE
MEELHELLVDGLRDIYDAEKQLVKALPKMTKALTSPELKASFNNHLEQTKTHVTRAEQCLELLGEKVKGKPCKAMKGLVEEAQEHLQEHEKGELLDQVLVGAAQKVEHYEIASYGTARAIAKSMGNKEAMNLLQETLREEEGQDKQLTTIAIKLQRGMGRAKPDLRASSNGGGSRTASRAASNGTGRGGAKKK